jgi:hypothetical protein
LQLRVEEAEIEDYRAFRKDKSRPPSKGGNTGAWHQHVLRIGGESYSFLAAHAGKFVYKGERVSFDWDWDETNRFRNVVVNSVVAHKRDGSPLIRGSRDDKAWRTADTRLPARRGEWKD